MEKVVVAETYRKLQGLNELEEIFAISKNTRSEAAQVVFLLRVCCDLIFLNVSSLEKRNLKSLEAKGEFTEIAQRCLWIRELIEIAQHITNDLRVLSYEMADDFECCGSSCEAIEVVKKSRNDFGLAILDQLDKNNVANAIDLNSQFDPFANLVHMLKVNYHNFNCVLASLDSVSVPESTNSNEVYELECKVIDTPSLRIDNFLQQFRLLHQIPELIGLFVVRNLSRAIHRRNIIPRDSIAEFTLINRLVSIVRKCVRPLAYELLPTDYARIRYYLGVTSGSDSKTLSTILLTKLLPELIEFRIRLENDYGSSPQYQRLRKHVFELYEQLNLWREQHVHFPRNVLGRGSVKSLIGSDEAVEAAVKMATTNHRSGKTDQLQAGRALGFRTKTTDAVDRLDKFLLECTGNNTKKNFMDVQNRTGIYSKKRNKRHKE